MDGACATSLFWARERALEVNGDKAKCALGIDFGTLSARAVVVDVQTGEELGTATHPYAHGVIAEYLPGTDVALPPGFALQDPADYLAALKESVRGALAAAGVDPQGVVGIGISFTSCTVLPVRRDGTPLCFDPTLRREPYAWVQSWKQLTAQEEADRMTEIARACGAVDLTRYGDRVSAQWLFPKAWRILRAAPHVYAAADRILEAGDWLVWQLTGQERRSASMAAYKALWDASRGYPDKAYFAALDPRLATVVEDKVQSPIVPVGASAGGLKPSMAAELGLPAGIPVAAANIDAHAAVPGSRVTEPNRMTLVMGTSLCHIVLAEAAPHVAGVCGVAPDSIVPGLYAYEAGQPAMGDLLQWFAANCVPGAYEEEARRTRVPLLAYLEEKASRIADEGSGLLALDWWNGNRSVLDDARLSGVVLGLTLNTRPEHVYLALIESLAFGTAVILERFMSQGIAVEGLVACGGQPTQNRLLMQVFADVTGRPIEVAATQYASAVGAAVYGAVAAGAVHGGYATVQEAVRAMTRPPERVYRPDPRRHARYQALYRDYRRLHDYFGGEAVDVMHRLRGA